MATTESTLIGFKPKKLSTRKRQRILLAALKRNYGYLPKALKETNIPARTYYNWMTTDPVFAKRVQYLYEERDDSVMKRLMQRIDAGDTRAIIFYLTRYHRDRGYWTIPSQQRKRAQNSGRFVPSGGVSPHE